MKVKQLIAELNKMPPAAKVLMSSDAEGNDFHELEMIEGVDDKHPSVVLWPGHDDVDPED